MLDWIDRLNSVHRNIFIAATVVLVLLVGIADYVSTAAVSFSVFYAIPIALAVLFVGTAFAFSLAVLSVGLWVYGDLTTGPPVTSIFIPLWNAAIRLAFYGLFIGLLHGLRQLQQSLERRVEERAAELTREIVERERLERELLAVSEREQRRIGQDLHDGLCQHLTGTALASQVLAEKLALKDLPEAADARKIAELTEEGITLSRSLAKGLNPVDMQIGGLMQALDEFAATTSDLFKVKCSFDCEYPVLIANPGAAAQLYWIAHEAVGNAIKHGFATRITITLEAQETGALLSIRDNGCGLPDPIPANDGMGLRIMAHRAKVIGAAFRIRNTGNGTEVVCTLPNPSEIQEMGHA